MSADCIGGKMLVALADPEQARLSCPECGAKGLQRASVVNGHGVVPHHKFVPHRTAGIVAAQPPKHDLTPSEVALAKVLAAWEDWPGAGGAMNPVDHAMRAVGSAINDYGMVSVEQEGLVLSDKGSALLDRARKAGVL